jgi:integrase
MARRGEKLKRKVYGIGSKWRRGRIWWVKVFDGNGKAIRRSTGSTNEADADDLLGKLLRERSRGDLAHVESSSAINIAYVLDAYMERNGKLAPGTARTYRSQINNLLKPYFGLIPPSRLTTEMLTDYREMRERESAQNFNGPKGTPTRLNRKVSSTTVNRELGLLRSALRHMAKRRPKAIPVVPYFPMESERDNVRMGFISQEDFEGKLYPHLPRHLKALVACAFFVGGRKSEWLRLNWDDVDFKEMIIRFNKTKNRYPREVPIVPGLMFESLAEARKIRDAAWPNEPAVFLYDGIRMRTVGSAWRKACERAGFAGLSFHDMRRSSNKNMRDRGIPQSTRMKIMGHRTASMDLRYGIVDLGDVKEAGRKLGQKATSGGADDLK